MSINNLQNLSGDELVRYVDRSHPEVRVLAERLDRDIAGDADLQSLSTRDLVRQVNLSNPEVAELAERLVYILNHVDHLAKQRPAKPAFSVLSEVVR